MSSETLYDVVEHCIDLMRQGASIDECLRRYPKHAPLLRPQLEAARAIEAARPPAQADPAAMARGRARLLGAVADAGRQPPAPEPVLAFVGPLRSAFSGVGRLAIVPYAAPAVLAMLLLGGAAFGVAAATGNSGPGNIFGGSSDSRIEVRGLLAAIDADSLTVTTGAGDVTVLLTADTAFEAADGQPLTPGDFVVGAEVKVKATRDGNGDLVAHDVELEAEEQDEDNQATPVASPVDDNGQDGNSGPGTAEDHGDATAEPTEIEDEHEDNSGPGDGDDGDDATAEPTEAEDEHDDNSGRGDGDEADDSGPGGEESDSSGPGGD